MGWELEVPAVVVGVATAVDGVGVLVGVAVAVHVLMTGWEVAAACGLTVDVCCHNIHNTHFITTNNADFVYYNNHIMKAAPRHDVQKLRC